MVTTETNLANAFKYILTSENKEDEIILCTSDFNELNHRTNVPEFSRDANLITIDGTKYLIKNIAIQTLSSLSIDILPNQTGIKYPYSVIISIVIELIEE